MQEFNAYAALHPNGPLEPFSFDPGPLGPEEVEIKVSHCGLCHSDLSMLDNEWGMSQYPFVPGHEVTGTVVALGQAKVGPLLCGGITVFSPFLIHEVPSTARVGIIGIGGLGHMALQFANKWGCEVHAFTTSDSKETEARQLGAHYVHNTRKDGALKNLGRNLDLIISTINAPLDMSAFLDTLAPKGSFHNVGAVLKPLEVPAFGLILGQKSVAGSPTGSPTAIDHMLEFSARHSVAPVVEYFPMSNVNDALERLRSGKVRYRIVLINDFDKTRSMAESRAKEQPEAALTA